MLTDIFQSAQDLRPVTDNSDVVHVDVVRVNRLAEHEIEIWDRIRESSGMLASPYFDLNFVKAVDRVRKDVFVAVLRDAEHMIVGFFPFQRPRRGYGEAVGGMLNDLHGIIGYECCTPDLQEIVKLCGLRSFKFHALDHNTTEVDRFEFQKNGAYYVDLSSGWDDYFSWARSHSRTVKKQAQKTRALEREYGELRFEFDCLDPETLEKLIQMKRARYKRGKTFDILSVRWASDLLREIHQMSANNFQGILSCLWAGDHLVASHFGMLSGDVLHYWFPAYDYDFKRFSPGTELILQVCRDASGKGIRMVDFGYGDDAYKFKFCNATRELSCGMVRRTRASFLLSKQKFMLRRKLKEIPMKDRVKTVLRGIFPDFGEWNFK